MVKRRTAKRERGPGTVSRARRPASLDDLPTRDPSSGRLHVVVDTPRGSPVKFKYDLDKGCYTIAHILPAGATFPYDFGSIPRTRAEDGDPLDVLILMEWPSFAGCLVPVRLIGVLEAEQTQEGETNRNDRLIGTAERSRAFGDARSLKDLPSKLLSELEHFFVSYNGERGRDFRVLGRLGAARAEKLVAAGERRFRESAETRAAR
jgi:inorganic pyrophosphatase